MVKIDEFALFPMLYIMTAILCGFLLTPIRMTLNNLECPIHVKVRLYAIYVYYTYYYETS